MPSIAYGIQDETAQDIPMMENMVTVPTTEDTNRVLQMQNANKPCEITQRRRVVNQGVVLILLVGENLARCRFKDGEYVKYGRISAARRETMEEASSASEPILVACSRTASFILFGEL
jgi:hypothetical protein